MTDMNDKDGKPLLVPYDEDLKERLKNPEYAWMLVQKLSAKLAECERTLEEIVNAAYDTEQQLKTAIEALKFYAARSDHHPRGGDTAREALAKIRGGNE